MELCSTSLHCFIDILMEEIKPVGTEKRELESRDESMLKALFGELDYESFDVGNKLTTSYWNRLPQVQIF